MAAGLIVRPHRWLPLARGSVQRMRRHAIDRQETCAAPGAARAESADGRGARRASDRRTTVSAGECLSLNGLHWKRPAGGRARIGAARLLAYTQLRVSVGVEVPASTSARF